MPFTAVRTAGCRLLDAVLEAAEAGSGGVFPAADTAQLLITLALALEVSKRLAAEAAYGLGDVAANGEPTPAAKVQRRRDVSPHRDENLAGGEAAAVSSAGGAPLGCSNAGVFLHRVERESDWIADEDSLP